MLHDMNNKENGNFTFIQEQIASKRKGRLKRMLFSLAWTMVLACVFGAVAAFVFCISEPRINKAIGKNDGKKEVQFPTQGIEDGIASSIGNSTNVGSQNISDISPSITPTPVVNEEEEKKTETVIIEKRVDGNLEDLENIYGELKRISNAYQKTLVTVTGTKSDLDWHDNEVDLATVTTGLVLAENGADILILVNYDKVSDAKNIRITLWDQSSYIGRIQGYDEELNIAIVAVSLDNFTQDQIASIQYAELGESYNISLGEPILALGAPSGHVGSMGFGIVSSKLTNRYVIDGKIDLFHTDIIRSKNSEGIIVDLNGAVVGIITQTLSSDEDNNFTTAIGISKIKRIIQSLVNEKERTYLGVRVLDMPDYVMEQYKVENGVYISEILPSSPSLEGGLQVGDIILAVNDSSVMSVQAFQNIIWNNEAKNVVKMKVLRTTKAVDNELTLEITLGKKVGS